MQAQIDRGIKCCESCEAFGYNRFCGDCGDRFAGAKLEWRECSRCNASVSTDFCSLCGYSVADEYLRRWERGDIDFAAEQAHAEEIMARFYSVRPDLAPVARNHAGEPGLESPIQRAVFDVFKSKPR